MTTHDSLFMRATRWLLPAIAICVTLAGVPAAANAQAFSQQATGAEMDDALNWEAATGFRHAYARAPYDFANHPHFRTHGHG